MAENKRPSMEDMLASIREEYKNSGFADEFSEFETWEEMLPCSDGVKLRTIFYRPKTDKALPTIVQRCCYPHNEGMIRVCAEELCKKGFALVCQMCRGTGGSEGEWEPNVNDRSDGLDLLNYLNALPWIDCMGYEGASYLAFTGWVMADAVPEKMRSMYLTVYGTDRHTSAYKDGLFRQDILTAWAMSNAGFPVEADYLESARFRPQVEVDEKMWGHRLEWYRDWITNTSRTDPYWNDGFWKMLREIPGKMKIPVFIGEGWYDHHLGSALRGYESLAPEVKAHTTLNIGPWNHGFRPAITGHPDQKNGNGQERLNALRWFYETLKEKKLPDAKINTYIIGADTWKQWDRYPFETSGKAEFYLSGGKKDNAFSLTALPEGEAETSYIYDPENPVMSHGGESLFQTRTEIGSLLQPECGWREDVVSFVSEPLEKDLTIVGQIDVSLFVSSDAEDTAFTVKLMEVFESGESYNIRNGITTLGYRNGSLDRIGYEKNSVEEIGITCWDVAWQLKKGSRLRLDVSSSNFPEYAVHPNKAGVWALAEDTVPAKQTLYFGKEHPAKITLPLMED